MTHRHSRPIHYLVLFQKNFSHRWHRRTDLYIGTVCARLFQAMSAQLSFGIEREILVDELQFYFEQNQAAEFEEDDINGMDSRKKANEMLRLLEKYGWLEVETDKELCAESQFLDYAVKVMKTLLEISDGQKGGISGLYLYHLQSCADQYGSSGCCVTADPG